MVTLRTGGWQINVAASSSSTSFPEFEADTDSSDGRGKDRSLWNGSHCRSDISETDSWLILHFW